MKPFNIERAKAGDPVVTRDGRKVRILCFDRLNLLGFVITGLVMCEGQEVTASWTVTGRYLLDSGPNHPDDLFMAPVKKEGWINVYRGGYVGRVYNSEEEAISNRASDTIQIVKIEWEE